MLEEIPARKGKQRAIDAPESWVDALRFDFEDG
jgi:hypothetical protein